MPLETIAGPLLFRHLELTRAIQFVPVAKRLEAAVSRVKAPGSHVRFLSVVVPIPMGTDADGDEDLEDDPRPLPRDTNYDLIRILYQVPNLHSFYMKNACRPSFLAVFSSSLSASSIERLDITLSTEHMPGETLHAVSDYLNRLVSLRTLKLVCHTDWPTADAPALRLPQLRHFVWDSYHKHHGGRAHFLDRCEMDNLVELAIHDHTDGVLLPPEGILAIRLFVSRLPQLRCLALGIAIDDTQLNALLPSLPSHIKTLDFIQPIINAKMVPLIPSSIRTLRIAVAADEVNDPLWAVLDCLANEPRGVRTICIYLWLKGESVPFTWTAGLRAMKSPEQHVMSLLATMTGRLLTHSLELTRRGIRILDDDGLAASVHISFP
jgi:hypothetical protein